MSSYLAIARPLLNLLLAVLQQKSQNPLRIASPHVHLAK